MIDISKISRQSIIPWNLTLEYSKNTGNKKFYKTHEETNSFTQRNKRREKMADNSDNEGGINATDFAADVSLRLPLGELGGRQHFGAAIANKRFILEIAQMLKTIGDLDVEVEQPKPEESRKLKRHISVKEYFRSASLTKVLHTLDIALRWLERSSKKCTNDETKGQNSDTSQQLTPVDQTDAGATVGGNQQPNPDEYQKKENVLRGLIYVIGKTSRILLTTTYYRFAQTALC